MGRSRCAGALARCLWVSDVERYACSYYPSDEEYGVRKGLRVRPQLVTIRQQVGNQIRALLNAYFAPSPGTAVDFAASLMALFRIELPTADLTLCLQTLGTALRQTQEGIEQLTKQIRQRSKATPVQALETQLPSVGPQTALTHSMSWGTSVGLTTPSKSVPMPASSPRGELGRYPTSWQPHEAGESRGTLDCE